ncbi:MAG: nuclear transport factor 2 family protein [Alphaproteobacteria bacterium]|nr:nuclear transport factor 2 family protein [Alphaproteobacteria bacterium]
MANEDEAAIRGLIDERVSALRERDAARAVAMLAPDLVAFELAPPLVADRPTDAAATQAWFDGLAGPVETEVRDLTVHVCGDVAFAHSLNRLRVVRKGGAVGAFWMRSTLGFRKRDGEWKIVHAHTSVPMRMDGTFTAAMDLEP